MAQSIGVIKERHSGETRVAIVPELVERYRALGLEVLIEQGAGEAAFFSDAAFRDAGATLGSRTDVLGADVLAIVAPAEEDVIAALRPGTTVIGFLSPLDHPGLIARLALHGATAISMELVPRISRAQKMDALSAMSSIGGYRAVLLAASLLPSFFPLMTTAAGTVRPASVLVLGAGVAGLQAIATARRLGARVSAYDIRDAVREEVKSLGASFVELELETQQSADTGGYAKALAEEKARRQTELLVPSIAASDVVISTALIPGRPAPVLITREAVGAMKPGSVIIDMAAANGGNCELTQVGSTVVEGGVSIVGPTNLAAEMPVNASQMYARTVYNMVSEFTREGTFAPDFDDDIIKSACVAHNGEIVNERVRSLVPQ
jgi:H+-translocating NAD(P) transhydrogenase subunit alpha